MTRISFPRRLEVNTVFRGRYTIGDIFRIGIPALAGIGLAGPPGILAGVAGLGLAEYQPRGKHLDRHLVDAARYHLGLAVGQWPDMKIVDSRAAVATNGVVLGLVRVSSVDLDMLSEPEIATNLETVNDLFTKTGYPLKLYSRQRRADLTAIPGADGSTVVTEHYVTVPVFPGDASTLQNQVTALDDRCEQVRTALTAGDMYAERVTGTEFYETITDLASKPDSVGTDTYQKDGEVCRVLAIDTYPTQVPPGWLADVLNVDAPGLVDAVQTVAPIKEKDRNRLQQVLSKATVERAVSSDPVRERELLQVEKDIRDLIDIQMEGEPLLHYGVYIVARADNSRDLETTVDRVSSELGQIEHLVPSFKTNQAARTVSPFFKDRLGNTHLVPGTSAAAGFPWAASGTFEENGVVFGEEKDGNPVIIDRFSWDAPHIAVTGKNGSGKSFWVGLLLQRSINTYDDLDVWIVDPKQRDYAGITEALDGETVVLDDADLSTLPSASVVRFTVEDPSRDNTDMLVDTVRRIYHEASKDAAPSFVVIDELHRLITDGESVNKDGLQAVSTVAREGRDRNIGLTIATQNADEITRTGEGKNLLRNVDCYVFFKQQDVDTEVEDFFRLTDTEAVRLRKLRTGNKVGYSEAIIRGPVNTTLRIEATEPEATTIEGNVDEHDADPKGESDAEESGSGEERDTENAPESPFIIDLMQEDR